jgi:hypothetical protein
MPHIMLSILSLFIMLAVVLMTPLVAYPDPANSEEIAHMKAGHQQPEGVAIQ